MCLYTIPVCTCMFVGYVYLFIQATFLHVENCQHFGSLNPVGYFDCFHLMEIC
jgi:hypothetical protein